MIKPTIKKIEIKLENTRKRVGGKTVNRLDRLEYIEFLASFFHQ